MNYKIPISVLVIIYNNFGNILLLKRADSPKNLDLWQSVTGSKENSDANLVVTACREIYEETKFFATEHQIENLNLITNFEILPYWKHKYAPNITHNQETAFAFCTDFNQQNPILAQNEHTEFVWLPYKIAAEKCFSPSNKQAILKIAKLKNF